MLTRDNLHAYQRRAVDFIIEQKRSALFLDMGLGKTTTSLTAASDLLAACAIERVLIIAPLRVANSVWVQETQQWSHLKHLRVSVCTGPEKKRIAALQSSADVYTINRENVPWLVKHYGKKWPFDCVIVDESSSFKSPGSQRFKALKKVAPLTEYLWLLTGTPSPNGLLDLWPQMYLVDFGERLGRTMTGYKQRFFEQDYMGYNWTPRDGSDAKVHSLIDDKVISMSAEDYLEVPERIDIVERIEMPSKVYRSYRDFERTMLAVMESGDEIEAISAAVLANKLLQLSGGAIYTDEQKNWQETHTAKLDALADIAEQNEGENILVAYNFKSDLARLKRRFPDAVVLDKQQKTIDDWNAGKIKMLLAQPACLHPETEILSEHRGWVKIVDVLPNERVHDGVEFVSHKGCYFSGRKVVIERFGIKMTTDHKMLVDDVWVEAKYVRDCEETRQRARHTVEGYADGTCKMSPLWGGTGGIVAKREKIKSSSSTTLSVLYKRNASQHDQYKNLEDLARHGAASNKGIRTFVQRLWGPRDKTLRKLVEFRKLLSRYVPHLRGWIADRSYRCEWGLSERKLPLGYSIGPTVKQEGQSSSGLQGFRNAFGGILQGSRRNTRCAIPKISSRDDGRRSRERLVGERLSKKQEISDVYDLVDCGPRNRFLVKGDDGYAYISHNSAGHGINLQKGGSMIVWFALNWSLELYQQFNGRLHRQGQTKPVRIIHIIAADTIDERVMSVIDGKDQTQNALLNALKTPIHI